MLVEVFKVLVLDRIPQSIWSRSLKIQFLRFGGKVVEVFKGSLPVQNSAAAVEQIVDIPARRGLPDFLPGQGSASSSSRLHDVADEAFTGFFALFLVRKKVRSWACTRGRNCSPSRAHPRGELMRTGMLQGDVVTSL